MNMKDSVLELDSEQGNQWTSKGGWCGPIHESVYLLNGLISLLHPIFVVNGSNHGGLIFSTMSQILSDEYNTLADYLTRRFNKVVSMAVNGF